MWVLGVELEDRVCSFMNSAHVYQTPTMRQAWDYSCEQDKRGPCCHDTFQGKGT